MHCAHCGAQVMPGQRFCSKCGQPVADARLPARRTSPRRLNPRPGQSRRTWPERGIRPSLACGTAP